VTRCGACAPTDCIPQYARLKRLVHEGGVYRCRVYAEGRDFVGELRAVGKSAPIDCRKRDGCCMIHQITSSYGGQTRSICAWRPGVYASWSNQVA